jgi:hypothetical protein
MNIKKIFWGSLAIVGFASCEPIEEVGPDLCPSDDFSFNANDLKLFKVGRISETSLVGNGDVLPLDSMGLHIQSNLGVVLNWKVTITNGYLKKRFSGNDSLIDILWYGQADYFDGTNLSLSEGVTNIELDIICQDLITKTITIEGNQSFKNVSSDFGLLIRDWDQNGKYPVRGESYTFFDGAPFFTGLADPQFNVFDYFDETPSQSGGKYLQVESASASDPLWYFGDYGIDIPDFEAFLSSNNLDSLYVNVLVSREGSISNVPANFGFRDTVPSPNAGAYLVNENINWTGWKLLSYKFSDFKNSKTDLPLSDITLIKEFLLNFGASPNLANATGIKYDMVLFTVGKPLYE